MEYLSNQYKKQSDYFFEAERRKEEEHKKKFKFLRRFKSYDLYVHKKYPNIRECFKRRGD